MGAVRKSTREGEAVFSREVGYEAREAGGGLEFVCEVQSRGVAGVMWLEGGGRDAGVTSAAMAQISTTLHKVHAIG